MQTPLPGVSRGLMSALGAATAYSPEHLGDQVGQHRGVMTQGPCRGRDTACLPRTSEMPDPSNFSAGSRNSHSLGAAP